MFNAKTYIEDHPEKFANYNEDIHVINDCVYLLYAVADVFSGSGEYCSIYSCANDIELLWNLSSGKYTLSLTDRDFPDQQECIDFLDNAFALFDIFCRSQPGFDPHKTVLEYYQVFGNGHDLEAESLEELYAKFKLLVDGFRLGAAI